MPRAWVSLAPGGSSGCFLLVLPLDFSKNVGIHVDDTVGPASLAGVCMQIASPGDKFHIKFIFYRARNCPEGSKE